MAVLRIQSGQLAGTAVPVQDSSVILGRGKNVAVRLSDEGSSRQHAEIFKVGALHFIRDLSSRNGTFVNSRRITESILREGDQIRIGDTVMLFLERADSPLVRVLSPGTGSQVEESVRFRDTMVGAREPAAPPADDRKSAQRNLRRRVAQIIASQPTPKAIFADVVREVGRALGGDRADILFIDEVDPEVRFHAVATHDTEDQGEISVSRTILREAIEHREAVVSSDAAQDRRFNSADSIAASPTRSVICVPLLAGGAVAGVLYVCDSRRPQAFGKEELEAAADVGLQLSAVLGSLKLLESREDVLRTGVELAVRAAAGGVPAAADRGRAVAHQARAIAHALGLSAEDASRAWVAGMLHGVIDAPVGSSPGKKAAAPAGAEPILDAIACQDERHDGSGRPRGRVADEIPILGRVLSLAKEIDRLTREGGAGGKPLDLDQALAAVRKDSAEKFHPDVLGACLVAHRNGTLAPGSGTAAPSL
jgi:pSer/pThr/pTyr-binding forkhead associated (FHA) protein